MAFTAMFVILIIKPMHAIHADSSAGMGPAGQMIMESEEDAVVAHELARAQRLVGVITACGTLVGFGEAMAVYLPSNVGSHGARMVRYVSQGNSMNSMPTSVHCALCANAGGVLPFLAL